MGDTIACSRNGSVQVLPDGTHTIFRFSFVPRRGKNHRGHSFGWSRPGQAVMRMAADTHPSGAIGFPELEEFDMPKGLICHRKRAYERQQGLCHYCASRMWLGDPKDFSRQHGCSIKAARHRQCTAEHLLARQDGGRDTAENIVAACRYCNAARHRRRKPLSADQHVALVRRRLQEGRWFRPVR